MIDTLNDKKILMCPHFLPYTKKIEILYKQNRKSNLPSKPNPRVSKAKQSIIK